jgi:ABC-type bacteriocin/lantibiotic exporter with double-glycine peptidase domain
MEACAMLPNSLYAYIWDTTRAGQVRICLLTALVAPMAVAPLELQRRIVDDALTSRNLVQLLALGAAYAAVVLIQNGLKYLLNLTKGRTLEDVTRDLRRRILERLKPTMSAVGLAPTAAIDEGTTLSILAAEAEDVGGFASESFAVPLLQIGTMTFVIAYLMWVEPLIAVMAFVIYLPQAILVPRVQATINRLARQRTTLVRRLGHHAVGRDNEVHVNAAGRFRHALHLIERAYTTRIRIYYRKFALTFLGNVLDAAGPIVVLMIGGYLVIRAETEIGTLVVFISGFQRLAGPWDELITFYRSSSNARIAYRLVADAIGEAPPAARA